MRFSGHIKTLRLPRNKA